MKIGIEKVFLYLSLFIPASWLFSLLDLDKTIIFVSSVLAVIPLARVIGYATKELALQTNPAVGGLVNATFGNAIELFIAILALRKGLLELVRASIVGSIIGNILLLTGLSVFFGGIKYREQRFNQSSIGVSSTMLIIMVVGLAIPSVYSLAVKGKATQVQFLSDSVAIILALIYLAGIVFAFFTHKHLFDASDEVKATQESPSISKMGAMWILLVATLVVAVESELLAGTVEEAARSIGLSHTFIGIVVIAIITNIAEKANAIHFALQDKLDISLEIGLSSAIQIALFVVPILVFVSQIFNFGFNLVFSMFETAAILFAVMIVNYLSADGKCHWLEGAQLITVYLIIAIAFFFV